MQHNEHSQHGRENHYVRLAGMIVLSFISMYVLMYSMVHSFADVYNSLNQVYMAGLMTAPMVVIEMLLMSSMYMFICIRLAVIEHVLGTQPFSTISW